MSPHDLPTEPEWLVTSRKAAYCPRRRLNGADLSPQDMEDMIQVATLAYWKHHREGRPVPFCFVCARQAAEKYFYRKVLGRIVGALVGGWLWHWENIALHAGVGAACALLAAIILAWGVAEIGEGDG